MEKDYNQSNIPGETARQLNVGLFQIQSEIDNIKLQVQQSKQQRKTEQAFTSSGFVEHQNANDAVLNKLSEQMSALSREVNELKRDIVPQLTTEEIAKAVNCELSRSFGTLFVEMKNTIIAKVETEFATLKAIHGSHSEKVEETIAKNIVDQTQIVHNVENVAIGVEQKLELKFSEMFLELNNVISEIKVQKTEQHSEMEGNRSNFSEIISKITKRLNGLTLNLDSFGKLLESNTKSVFVARGDLLVDNQKIIERFDKLAEFVVELIGDDKENMESENISEGNKKSDLFEKINGLSELINSRKDLDFRPIYEILNELDEKLADIKYGLSDTVTALRVTSDVDESTNNSKEETVKILNEMIPRLIRESVANSLVNVDDSENKGSYEKLANQINLIFANEEQKFDEVFKQITELKNGIGIANEANSAAEEYHPKEIEDTLTSLRSELMSLSKLISDAETDDETPETSESSIPKAISDATDTLDELTKEIF